jgi:uncharacterized delta-60 repeat protein
MLGSLLLVALPSAAFAQGGTLDATFGDNGKVMINLTAGADSAYGVVIQADGKIVTAGQVGGSGGRFGVIRSNADGWVDATFGGTGWVATNFTSGFDAAGDLVLQGDGKIVAAGIAGGNDPKFALARYTVDGSLDTSFSGDGKVTTNFTSRDDLAYAVAVQGDGKIVAAGEAAGSGGRIALVRYDAAGTLDTTFSGDGRVATNFTSGADFADVVAIQADQKIIVAGTADYFGRDARFALARYNADGSLDTTFGGDGKVTTNFSSGFDGAFGLAIQPADGKVVAGGQARGKFALARYDITGALDATFGGDGKVRTDFTTGVDALDELRIQPDNKIVVAGGANFFGANSKFALARYNPEGSLDATFSGDGKVTTNLTWGVDIAYSVAIQPIDGKIVAVGEAETHGPAFALARYLGS